MLPRDAVAHSRHKRNARTSNGSPLPTDYVHVDILGPHLVWVGGVVKQFTYISHHLPALQATPCTSTSYEAGGR